MQVQRDGITRRSFLGLATSSVAAALVGCNSGPESSAERSLLRLETSTTAAAVPVMTWDTEGARAYRPTFSGRQSFSES
jgi:hypothetical protein